MRTAASDPKKAAGLKPSYREDREPEQHFEGESQDEIILST